MAWSASSCLSSVFVSFILEESVLSAADPLADEIEVAVDVDVTFARNQNGVELMVLFKLPIPPIEQNSMFIHSLNNVPARNSIAHWIFAVHLETISYQLSAFYQLFFNLPLGNVCQFVVRQHL